MLRAGDAMRQAAGEAVADDHVLVLVTHDSVGRAMLMQALDQPLSAYRRLLMAPCSISEIDAAGAATQVLGVNATEHLAGL